MLTGTRPPRSACEHPSYPPVRGVSQFSALTPTMGVVMDEQRQAYFTMHLRLRGYSTSYRCIIERASAHVLAQWLEGILSDVPASLPAGYEKTQLTIEHFAVVS